MLTLRTDIYITRRLRSHFIVDDDEFVRFTAPTIDQCLAWLIDNDYTAFILDAGAERYYVTLHRKVS